MASPVRKQVLPNNKSAFAHLLQNCRVLANLLFNPRRFCPPRSSLKATCIQTTLSSCLLVLLSPTMAAANTAEFSAAALMQQMSNAVRSLNYQGNFLYQHRDQIEVSNIAHRSIDGLEQERILSMTGDGRELIRHGNRSYCYMPAQKTVLIGAAAENEQKAYTSPTNLAAQWDINALQKWYRLSVAGADRVAGRSCQRMQLIPKDRHRYGYRLCVDSENAMLLDAGLVDRQGKVLERMMFTDIRYPETFADALFVQRVPDQSWQVVRMGAESESNKQAAKAKAYGGLRWMPASVPPGFDLHHRRFMAVGSGTQPVKAEQLVYSDGIASVSIFIESVGRSPEIVGPIRMGAMHGYGRVQSGQQIMVVGDVPAATVQWFAEELERATTESPAKAQ